MENDTPLRATAVTRPRLYSIVHTYIQKQLPRDIHPAFQALRDREEAATTSPQIDTTKEKTLPLLVKPKQGSRTDQVCENQDGDEDDDDILLYAASQGRCRFVFDSVKGRLVQRCCE